MSPVALRLLKGNIRGMSAIGNVRQFPAERASRLIFDLIRRDEHDLAIPPFRNRIARALVIADRLLNRVTNCFENSALQQFVGCGFRL